MDFSRENDRKGLVGTIFIHIILFLLLLIWTVGQANDMLDEQGAVEVSFGDPISGGDDATSEVAETNPTQTESNPATNTQPSPENNDPVVTNDDADQPEVNTSPTTTNPSTEPEIKPEPADVDPRLKRWAENRNKPNSDQTKNTGNNKNDKPGGSTTADNPGPGGTNQGNNDAGMSWNLEGFSVADWPDIKNNSQEAGKVVVEICLNASGIINRITIGPGTTTSSVYLRNLSIQSVRNFTFKAKGSQTTNNCGTITIVYKTN